MELPRPGPQNQDAERRDDDMDDVINRDRLHSQPLHDDLPRVDYSAFHRSLKDGRENDSDLFYRWKVCPTGLARIAQFDPAFRLRIPFRGPHSAHGPG